MKASFSIWECATISAVVTKQDKFCNQEDTYFLNKLNRSTSGSKGMLII